MTKPFKQEDLSEALWGEQNALEDIIQPWIDSAIEDATLPLNYRIDELETDLRRHTINLNNLLNFMVAKGFLSIREDGTVIGELKCDEKT